MTDQDKQHRAFWLGRNDADARTNRRHRLKPEYRAAYARGWDQVRREDALDADTEWDDD